MKAPKKLDPSIIRVLNTGQKPGRHPDYRSIPESPLELYYAGKYRGKAGTSFRDGALREQTWLIVYYREGRVETRLNDDSYEMQPGMALIASPGMSRAEYALTDYTHIFVTVGAPNDYEWPRLCLDDEAHTLGNLMAMLEREFNNEQSRQEEALHTLTRYLDVLLRRTVEEPFMLRSNAELVVAEVEAIMESEYGRKLTINDIARRVHVTPPSLHHYFTQLRGRTPLDHLHNIRIRHAVDKITRTQNPFEDIALQCGYNSGSHMWMHVKRVMGTTPSQLRKNKQPKSR